MPDQKYAQFYKLAWFNNQELFDEFKKIHDAYAKGDASKEADFHEVGRKVVDAFRDWDRRLCSGMSRGNFSQYSSKLSEKFWERIRQDFARIDEVGIMTKK